MTVGAKKRGLLCLASALLLVPELPAVAASVAVPIVSIDASLAPILVAGLQGRGRGGPGGANRSGPRVRNDARPNLNHSRPGRPGDRPNVNVNRPVNVNVNNRPGRPPPPGGYGGGYDRHYYHDYHDDWDDHWHPLRTIGTVAVTAAVVGTIVRSIPPDCSSVVVNGASYSQCGSTWYQPQYAGSSVQYVVVNPPR